MEEALKFWPPYADYQRTDRKIPVVVLDTVPLIHRAR